MHRSGDQIVGAMKVANGTNALRITQIEGFGGGAGTRLVQAAIRESITRGFGGRIELNAADQAMGFYEKLEGTLIDPNTNLFMWSEEAALALLQQ